MSYAYDKVIKIMGKKKKGRKVDVSDEIQIWRNKWRERGPVEFAENLLICPPDVPPHPELGRVPEFVILTDDQKEFLIDLWKGIVQYIILAAGRGSGKTFVFAIYTTWRLCCFDYFTMTVMGGSSEQSEKIKEYIDFWRRRDKNIFYALYKSIGGGNKAARVTSRWDAFARFPACSIAGARGPHVTQLLIDEVCVGESRGKDGAQAILDATYQLTSSPNQLLGYSSTAQFILGKFYDVWTHYKELGFKRYRWSLAYHTSNMWFTVDKEGKKIANWTYIDDVLYKDRNPKHWKSNVWWVTQRDIEAFRKNSTDDQWLVEILGGISRGSGLVFSREDLAHCICDGHLYTKDKTTCKVCEPYTENCPMAKFYDLNLAKISERRGGVDFGEVSPNAMTVSGKRGNTVFVLYNDERVDGTEEILKWVEETAKKYKLFYVFADPEERAMRETLELRGFNVPHIWGGSGGQMKSYYVTNTKRFVEQHRVVIPIKFNYLVNSISALAYDERGNVRKHNDHSWDSWMYSMIDYNIDDLLGDGFYGKIKRGEREIRKIW